MEKKSSRQRAYRDKLASSGSLNALPYINTATRKIEKTDRKLASVNSKLDKYNKQVYKLSGQEARDKRLKELRSKAVEKYGYDSPWYQKMSKSVQEKYAAQLKEAERKNDYRLRDRIESAMDEEEYNKMNAAIEREIERLDKEEK